MGNGCMYIWAHLDMYIHVNVSVDICVLINECIRMYNVTASTYWLRVGNPHGNGAATVFAFLLMLLLLFVLGYSVFDFLIHLCSFMVGGSLNSLVFWDSIAFRCEQTFSLMHSFYNGSVLFLHSSRDEVISVQLLINSWVIRLPRGRLMDGWSLVLRLHISYQRSCTEQ